MAFRDKFLGSLDSAAKYGGKADYVCNINPKKPGPWLNCPACSGGPRPIEGKEYLIYIGTHPGGHKFSYGGNNFKRITYQYPTFTEEELLKKNKLSKAKGYYPEKIFYTPDYDQEPNSMPDYRNTLLWAPNITTNANGEATLEFFCSDIKSDFRGIVEGVSGSGLLGKNAFQFHVR